MRCLLKRKAESPIVRVVFKIVKSYKSCYTKTEIEKNKTSLHFRVKRKAFESFDLKWLDCSIINATHLDGGVNNE